MGEAMQRAQLQRHALFAGGGTGGHIFPALAVAEELMRRGWSVSFVGRPESLEERLIKGRGFPFHPLSSRPVVGQGGWSRLVALGTMVTSAWSARGLIRRLGARIVVGTGGYVSAPAVVGARLAGRPVLLFEPNAQAGTANRWLSRLAQGATVAHESAVTQMRCPAWVTGVPVRREFEETPLPDQPLRLLVLGGSQGARSLNLALPPALALVGREVGQLEVVHQAGEKNLEETRAAYEKAFPCGARSAVEVRVLPFLEEVARAMASAHLVVCRAGAITLAEVCAAGRPSLLVPLDLAEGHQQENARVLADAGAARVVPAASLQPTTVAATVAELLGDRDQLQAMGRSAGRLARRQASRTIADRVESVVRS
jgi:UDP-N-acetylglucosamine--N-acetylmuramyl-(pentapeptide) pyrophosphoryl-undecaprenol N-acetylglucosamine transferase